MEPGEHLLDIGDHFIEWLKVKADKNKLTKLMTTLDHFRENYLIARLNIKNPAEFTIVISGSEDDIYDGISFDFYRLREGQWRFGIGIEDQPVKGDLDLSRLGYARFMMAIMIYCLENHIKLPTDMEVAGDDLTIGICADSSEGFWGYMGMEMGRYSMDKDRYNSMTGPNCGYDREFLMRDWEGWIFSDSKKRKGSLKKSKQPKQPKQSEQPKQAKKSKKSKKPKKPKKKKPKKEKSKKPKKKKKQTKKKYFKVSDEII